MDDPTLGALLGLAVKAREASDAGTALEVTMEQYELIRDRLADACQESPVLKAAWREALVRHPTVQSLDYLGSFAVGQFCGLALKVVEEG